MKARLPEGFGGGGMGGMLKQAQKMQEDMATLQAELETREYEVTGGGGMVTVTVTGDKKVKALTLKPEVVDPEDIEMLQDIVIAAVNEALTKADDDAAQAMGALTGGMNMPNMPKLF